MILWGYNGRSILSVMIFLKIEAIVYQENPMRLHPKTRNFRQLGKARNGKGHLPQGRASQLVIL